MVSSIVGNEFKIESEGLKFIGSINAENTRIRGKWYLKTEDEEWREYIDLNLDKMS